MNLLEWLGQFGPEQYLFWTRVQSIAWTGADLVIVFFLIRCANLARSVLGHRPHRGSYAVLGATAFLAPCLVAAPSGKVIFALEMLITVPHFLLILYLLFANIRLLSPFLDRLMEKPGSAPPQRLKFSGAPPIVKAQTPRHGGRGEYRHGSQNN